MESKARSFLEELVLSFELFLKWREGERLGPARRFTELETRDYMRTCTFIYWMGQRIRWTPK